MECERGYRKSTYDSKKAHDDYVLNWAKITGRNYDRKVENKQYYIALLGGHCEDCGTQPGEEWPIACFDFHHLDATQKEKNLARLLGKSRAKVIPEIMKCALLCSNCHRRRHANLKPV
jgi:hypothetical protein